MIEAASSVLQTASFVAPAAKQAATDRSVTSENPPPQAEAPSVSEVPLLNIELNTRFDTAVIEVRRTGPSSDDVEQIPTDARLEAQRREQVRREQQAAALTESIAPPTARDSSQSTSESSSQNIQVVSVQPAQVQQIAAFDAASQSSSSSSSGGSGAGVSVFA